MSSILLNRIFLCDDSVKLDQYRSALNNYLYHGGDFPPESALPKIEIVDNVPISVGDSWEEPYYSEIDSSLITSTNTSSYGMVYTTYHKMECSIPYIVNGECMPIDVIKDGNAYHIENGKHRFLAYALLGRKMLPVSIREKSIQKTQQPYSMVEYRKELYHDGVSAISYPEQVLDFYDGHKEMFADTCGVEMRCLVPDKRYHLVIQRRGGASLEIQSGLSAGNDNRSGRATRELLTRLGYDIDMDYVKTHHEFSLTDEHDANNIRFDKYVPMGDMEYEHVISKMADIIPHSGLDDGLEKRKFWKLQSFISRHKDFETDDGGFRYEISGLLHDKEDGGVYYLVGNESVKSQYGMMKKYVYVFKDSCLTESNLNVRYLGRFEEESELYQKVPNMWKNYALNWFGKTGS